MLHFGALSRRGSHWFVRVHNDATGHYSWVTTGTGDKANAKLKRKALEDAEFHRAAYPDLHSVTFFAGVASWLTELSGRVRAVTLKKLRQYGDRWKAHFGDVELRTVNAAAIESYLSTRNVSNSSLNQERSLFKWFLHGWAMRHGYIESDPTAQIQRYPEAERKIRVVTDPQLGAALAEPPAGLIHDFVVVAIETGLRQGCLLKLEWKHVDLDAGWLHIPAELMKSNRDFSAPLSTRAIETFKKLRDRVTGRIFPYSADTLRRHWRRACKRAGLEDFHVHDLRRTFLTKCRQSGTPLEVAMVLSDHRDLATVLKCYRAVDDAELLRAVGREVGGDGREVSVVRSVGNREGRSG